MAVWKLGSTIFVPKTRSGKRENVGSEKTMIHGIDDPWLMMMVAEDETFMTRCRACSQEVELLVEALNDSNSTSRGPWWKIGWLGWRLRKKARTKTGLPLSFWTLRVGIQLNDQSYKVVWSQDQECSKYKNHIVLYPLTDGDAEFSDPETPCCEDQEEGHACIPLLDGSTKPLGTPVGRDPKNVYSGESL